MVNQDLHKHGKGNAMHKICLLCVVFILSTTLSADTKKPEYYLSYDELLRIRVGVDYGFVGLFGRVAYDKNEFSRFIYDQNMPGRYEEIKKGMELGINLNKTLFEYKKMEFIINGFTGYMLYKVNRTGEVNHSFWERMAEFGFVPELRFFKRASIILSPCLYRYFWTQDSNKNSVKYSELKIQRMTLTELHLGLKFLFF